MDAALVREVRFVATHRYGLARWSDEENRRRFGAQAEPHEHDWRVRVEILGPLDPDTSFVVDLETLDEALDRVLGGWPGGDLNQLVPDVREGRMQPSTESLARWIYGRLRSEVRPPARLGRVHVWESAELGAFYPATAPAP